MITFLQTIITGCEYAIGITFSILLLNAVFSPFTLFDKDSTEKEKTIAKWHVFFLQLFILFPLIINIVFMLPTK
jgi:hypothetical protein